MADEKMIRVWDFDDAPEQYQNLSQHGGDEDWVVLIPPHLVGDIPFWMDLPPFMVYSSEDYPQPDGSVMRITAHS